MEINAEFYKTEIGERVSDVIQQISLLLIAKCYAQIPADNIKTDLSDGWISSMDEMLDNYSAKLLPLRPNEGSETSIIVETADVFVVDAPLFHEEDGKAVAGDIHMIFEFGYNGTVNFEGVHY